MSLSNDTKITELRTKLQNLVTTLEEILNNANIDNPSEIENWRHKAKNILDEAKECLGDSSEHIMQQTREVASVANDFLHEKPWAGVGIGATLGLILGFILMRR
ncbi:MAG: hypothetical protein V6011_02780 [Candidatus Dasytiphilus stammeri]